MPLIILCGFPSSGKTYRAKQILAYLEARKDGKDHDDAVTATLEAVKKGSVSSGEENDEDVGKIRDGIATLALTKEALEGSNDDDDARGGVGDVTRSLPAQSLTDTISPPQTKQPTPTTTNPPPPSLTSSPTPTTTRRTNLPIHHISDATLHLPRSVYTTARTEKDSRATLYSAVKRHLSRDSVVVLDSGNYIKGYRYQLYCEAKAVGTTSCVVHIGTSVDVARGVNERRLHIVVSKGVGDGGADEVGSQGKEDGSGEEDSYKRETFDELVMRFEEPNPMARWDTPLYTVPWEDATPPLGRIWTEIVDFHSKNKANGTGVGERPKVVRPHQATVLPPTAPSNHLHALDRATQHVVSHINTYLQHHADASSLAGGAVSIPPFSSSSTSTSRTPSDTTTTTEQLTVHLPTTSSSIPLNFAQLQRMRRQFIALQRQQMGGLGVVVGGGGGQWKGGSGGTVMERQSIEGLFVDWLNDSFGNG